MSTTRIEDRVILLLRYLSKDNVLDEEPDAGAVAKKIIPALKRSPARGGYGFWKQLDEVTSISDQRWSKVYTRRQRPTPDMIEALAKQNPEYAFWLSTGITDATNGHIAPPTAQTFPERLYAGDNSSNEYFHAQLALFEKLFEESGMDFNDDNKRMIAAERTLPMAHWWDSPVLCNKAYELSASKEYVGLKKLWDAREQQRQTRIGYITDTAKRPWIVYEKKLGLKGETSDPLIGRDPRTLHQDHFDLWFISVDQKKSKGKP